MGKSEHLNMVPTSHKIPQWYLSTLVSTQQWVMIRHHVSDILVIALGCMVQETPTGGWRMSFVWGNLSGKFQSYIGARCCEYWHCRKRCLSLWRERVHWYYCLAEQVADYSTGRAI